MSLLKDKLKDIFKRQKDFQIELNFLLGKFLKQEVTSKETQLEIKQELTKTTVLQLFSEVNEVLNEINWKDTPGHKPIDEEKIKEEIIDIQHFVINLALTWGMDEKEFYDMFVKKNNKNYERFIK